MAKLFLSYAREDHAAAGHLARALERLGHDVWWDRELTGGSSFGPEIEQQLDAADVVVVLWSRTSIASPWVRDEAAIGRDANKLLPLTLDGAGPPIGFRQFHTIDLSGWRGRPSAAVVRKVEQTVRKLAAGAQVGQPAPAAAPRPKPERRFPLVPAAALAVAVVLAAGAYFALGGRTGSTRIVVAAAQSGGSPLAGEYATSIAADMAPILSMRAKDVAVVDPASSDGRDAEYRLAVSVTPKGQGADASLALTSRKEPGILWSKNWSVPDLGSVDLRQQMSFMAAETAICALEGDRGGLARRQGLFALYASACTESNTSSANVDKITSELTEVTRGAPGFSLAWATLAVIYAYEVDEAATFHQPLADPSIIAKAHAAIAKARKLDPGSGRADFAESLLQADPAKSLPLLDKAVDADPTYPGIRTYRAFVFEALGRNRAAIDDENLDVQLNPLSPVARANYIRVLAYGGRFSQAAQELATAQKAWPNSNDILAADFAFHLRYGDPRIAQAVMPRTVESDAAMIPYRAVIAARLDPSPAKIEAAIAPLRATEISRPDQGTNYLLALALFGRTDDAFALLGDPRFRPVIGSQYLFRPEFAKVRADPRFMKVAAEFGLVRYWKSSGNWPDFCTEETLTYDCKTEAAKYR